MAARAAALRGMLVARARRRGRAPWWLAASAAVVALVSLLPLAYLLATVADHPRSAARTIIDPVAAQLLARSVGLAAAVTVAAVAIAVPLAWLTVRTDLPGRRFWSVALALPLVIPSYIGAYLFVSALGPRGLLQGVLEGPLGLERLPSIYGFFGAWLVLTLFTYPLVLLPVRGALRRLDPQLEDAARGLGRSGLGSFFTVILPQLVPAIGAGALLVALYALSDFGAVSIMRFDSFTRAIYNAYQGSFDREVAASLAVLLVVVMLVVVGLEARARGRGSGRGGGRYFRSGPGAARPAPPRALGRWRWPALAFCAAVAGLALVLPTAVLGVWLGRSLSGPLDLSPLVSAAGNSLLVAGAAALVAAAFALPVTLLAVRHPSRPARLVERLSHTGYALPGVVVALALVFFGTRVALPLYQTVAMLVLALVILFLPQALGATRAALLQVPPRLEEAARSLGRSQLGALATVTAPLAAAGVTAGAALVFLTAIKELPAMLILAPIEFETLSTSIWKSTGVGSFERGALPALVLLAVSALPLYLMTLRDR